MSTLPATLFHLSDIHFGREDRQALAWVESEIARWNPAALVITGDLGQPDLVDDGNEPIREIL